MGLILGKSGFPMLKAGYPTRSDKYDVAPATLETGTAYNGAVMMVGTSTGLYKVAATISAAAQVAGVLLATNVKSPSVYPEVGASVATNAGEQFNLVVKGYVAVPLDADAVLANATENAPVYITSAGKLTTVSTSNVLLTWKFTGITELHGTTKMAEIVIC